MLYSTTTCIHESFCLACVNKNSSQKHLFWCTAPLKTSHHTFICATSRGKSDRPFWATHLPPALLNCFVVSDSSAGNTHSRTVCPRGGRRESTRLNRNLPPPRLLWDTPLARAKRQLPVLGFYNPSQDLGEQVFLTTRLFIRYKVRERSGLKAHSRRRTVRHLYEVSI